MPVTRSLEQESVPRPRATRKGDPTPIADDNELTARPGTGALDDDSAIDERDDASGSNAGRGDGAAFGDGAVLVDALIDVMSGSDENDLGALTHRLAELSTVVLNENSIEVEPDSDDIFSASCPALRSPATRSMPSGVAGSPSWVMKKRADLPSGDRNCLRPTWKSGLPKASGGR